MFEMLEIGLLFLTKQKKKKEIRKRNKKGQYLLCEGVTLRKTVPYNQTTVNGKLITTYAPVHKLVN